MARKAELELAGEVAESWIGAAFEISLVHHMLEDEEGSREKRLLMFKLGDFQLATELAYSRLFAQKDVSQVVNAAPSFTPLLKFSADAHSLLVFASGYWRALQDLSRVMPFVEIAKVLDENRSEMKTTVVARNHIEHISERITQGRKARASVADMPVAVFQQAIGRLEFPRIVFGAESFDLANLSAAVLSTGKRIAPALNLCFESGTRKYLNALLSLHESSGER